MSNILTFHRVVTRETRRAPHVKQERVALPEHLSLSPVFSGVRVARSLVFCVILFRPFLVPLQGRIQDFKLGGALKRIATSEARRDNILGISYEKSRFYAKKSYFFQLDPLGSTPALCCLSFYLRLLITPLVPSSCSCSR